MSNQEILHITTFLAIWMTTSKCWRTPSFQDYLNNALNPFVDEETYIKIISDYVSDSDSGEDTYEEDFNEEIIKDK